MTLDPKLMPPSEARLFVKSRLLGANIANQKDQKKKTKTKNRITKRQCQAILSSLKKNQDAVTRIKLPNKKGSIRAVNLIVILDRI